MKAARVGGGLKYFLYALPLYRALMNMCTNVHIHILSLYMHVHVIIYQLQRRIKNVFSFYKPLPMRDVIGVMTLYASILSARLIAGLIPGDITKRQ